MTSRISQANGFRVPEVSLAEHARLSSEANVPSREPIGRSETADAATVPVEPEFLLPLSMKLLHDSMPIDGDVDNECAQLAASTDASAAQPVVEVASPSVARSVTALFAAPAVAPVSSSSGADTQTASDEAVHLMIDIKMCMFAPGDASELYFSLFSAKEKAFLTDEYALRLTENGFPETGSSGEQFALFRDMTRFDFNADLWLVVRIVRFGRLIWEEKRKPKQKGERFLRRPYGVALLQITPAFIQQLLDDNTTIERERQEGKPARADETRASSNAIIYVPNEESQFTDLHTIVINKTERVNQAPKSNGIAIGMRMFVGALSDLIKTRPKLAPEITAHVRKLTPESLALGDSRHQLYVTLLNGHFSMGSKSAAKNIQIRVSLCNSKGEPIEAVTRGSGPMVKFAEDYSSTVYYHSNTPECDERITVRVPLDAAAIRDCHLYFELQHCSSSLLSSTGDYSSFAQAYLPLATDSGALLFDADHTLTVYELSKDGQRDMGLLPDLIMGNFAGNSKVNKLRTDDQSLKVRTQLRSSLVAQDADCQSLLFWRSLQLHKDPARVALKSILTGVAKKPLPAIMHLLPELLKQIILVLDSPDAADYHRSTFAVLASLLSDLSSAHVSRQVGAAVEYFALHQFQSTKVGTLLLSELIEHLTWATQGDIKPTDERFKVLQHALKGISMLLMFALQSHRQAVAANGDTVTAPFCTQLRTFIQRLGAVLARTEPAFLIAIQGFALRNALPVMASLAELFAPEDIATLLCQLMTSVQTTKPALNIDKLILLRDMVNQPYLSHPNARAIFLKAALKMLKVHLDVGSAIEQSRCISVLMEIAPLLADACRHDSELLAYLNLLPTLVGIASTLKAISMSIENRSAVFYQLSQVWSSASFARKSKMRRLLGSISSNDPSSAAELPTAGASAVSFDAPQLLIDTTTLVLQLNALLTTVFPSQVYFVFNAVQSRPLHELQEFYAHLLRLPSLLLQQSCYPSDWLIMRMHEIDFALSVLSWMGPQLRQNSMDNNDFDRDIWDQYFALALQILLAPELDARYISAARAAMIQSRYGDLRLRCVAIVNESWTALGARRLEFLDRLVPACLEAALSEATAILTQSRDWYFDLLLLEFSTTNAIQRVENQTIDAVDTIISRLSSEAAQKGGAEAAARVSSVTKKYMDFFSRELRALLDMPEHASARGMITLIDTFLVNIQSLFVHLTALQSLPRDRPFECRRVNATFALMTYLKQSGRLDMFDKYQQNLWQMHSEYDNQVERGLALVAHASSLRWVGGARMLPQSGSLVAESETKRKLRLLQMSIEAFDAGECYERAVEQCQTLAAAYQSPLHNLTAWSSALNQTAAFVDKIAATDRLYRAFYRVAFFGRDYQDGAVAQREFVYRSGNGRHPESVKDFTDRIKAAFPGAQVANTPDLPPDNVTATDFSGQYVQIITLTPSTESERDAAVAAYKAISGQEVIPTTKLTEQEQLAQDDEDANIPLRVRRYRQNNNVKVFSFSRVWKERDAGKSPEQLAAEKEERKKRNNEHRELWVARTYLTIAQTLPNVERRAQVVERHEVILSPIQNATLNIVTKNAELTELINNLAPNSAADIGPLTMQLSGVVDAAVQGGVLKYREAFFEGTYMQEFPSHQQFLLPFSQALAQQLNILSRGLDLFRTRCPENLMPLLEHLQDFFAKMRAEVSSMLP